MDTKTLLIHEATKLLSDSKTGDISTRAVCAAVGVGQPVLYRIFGDKEGLLRAVVDAVWHEYLEAKQSVDETGDPAEDLRKGWDAHTAFALAHPYAYQHMFGTQFGEQPESLEVAMQLLVNIMKRHAQAGRLRVSPESAAQIVMAANSGVALGLILRPGQYPSRTVSDEMREATLRSILTEAPESDGEVQKAAVVTLRANLKGSSAFTTAESALFDEWLQRI